MQDKRINLDQRLLTIAEMVGRCERYADIGCDHGRLGAFLLQRGWVQDAVLTDISEQSLKKARDLIRQLGLTAQFLVCDGADALTQPVDAVVIAGMGGTTIARIIENGREHLGCARLILQANIANTELRMCLNDSGYRISDERIVRDGRRHYVIIEAKPGDEHCDPRQLIVGPILLKRCPPELASYADFRLRVANTALNGARQGSDFDSIVKLKKEIEIWQEVAACL